MKNIPNLITVARIFGTMILVFIKPFSTLFFIIYFICGISDVLDGMVARKINSVSITGQLLDSIADFIMVIVLLFLFVINIQFPLWSIAWVVMIAVIRMTSLGIGFMRYRQLTFLHTYANKVTGFALFCFPLMYVSFGQFATITLLCVIASISALEELLINMVSDKLQRDIKSIVSLRKCP